MKPRHDTKNTRFAGKRNTVGLNDPILERDVGKLLCVYLKRYFIIEAVANLPTIIYDFYLEMPMKKEEISKLEDDQIYMFFMLLKIFRLFHISQSLESIGTIRDYFADVFETKRYMLDQILRWILTGLKFLMIIHFYTCGWLLIHHYKKEQGIMAFEYSDTDIRTEYVESLYLITTTASTVGYGDYRGRGSEEPVW